jgi:hypothetical protein
MSLLNCKKIRYAVASAGILFILGIALQTPRLMFGGEYAILTTLLSGSGLAAMVLSPAIMLIVGVLAMIPGVSRQLAMCNH